MRLTLSLAPRCGAGTRMSCDDCDVEVMRGDRYYPYRIGNQDTGWGTIMIMGCRRHVTLAIDRLNRSRPPDDLGGVPASSDI
jgi:hypothetical protein